ncbi:MAG: hypothetical protein U1F42_04475 [Candidatus Competibacteraceae bacterium]
MKNYARLPPTGFGARAITHQADAGITLHFLQRNARHARLDTTGLYLHAEDANGTKQWRRRLRVNFANFSVFKLESIMNTVTDSRMQDA